MCIHSMVPCGVFLPHTWLVLLQMILPPVHQLLYTVQQDNISGSELLQLLQTKVTYLVVSKVHLACAGMVLFCHPAGAMWDSRASFLSHAPALALQPGPVQAAISLVSTTCSCRQHDCQSIYTCFTCISCSKLHLTSHPHYSSTE